MLRQIHVYITGYVQGVGFRHYVKHHARKQAVNGWVRNLPDGRVEIVLQGKNPALEALLSIYRRGPMLAEVEAVHVKNEPVDSLHHEFMIMS